MPGMRMTLTEGKTSQQQETLAEKMMRGKMAMPAEEKALKKRAAPA